MPSLFQKIFRKQGNEDYNSGISLYNQGRYGEAIERFEAAVEASPENSTTYRLGTFYAAEAHANIGRSLLKNEDYTASINHFEKSLKETPNFPDLQYCLGVARFMSGDISGAVPSFERALDINPGYVEARCFLAIAQDEQGEKEDSVRNLKFVVEEHAEIPIQVNRFLLVNLRERETEVPEIGPVLELLDSTAQFREVYTEGISQFNLRKFDLAAGLLEQAAAMKPHYADVQCQLGLARYKNGGIKESVKDFQRALEINPHFLEAAYFLGMSLLHTENYREAEKAFDRAMDVRGDAPDVLYHQALAKMHLGKNSEAETLLEKVLVGKPSFAQAHYVLGMLHFGNGRSGEGIARLKEALLLEPHLTEAERDLGLMYMDQGEWEDAESLFSSMEATGQEESDLYCFLGRTRLGNGEFEAALRDFERVLAREPGCVYALKGSIRCQLKLGRADLAQARLDEALAAHPDFPDLWKLQGACYFRTSRYKDAERAYKKALSRAPRDPEIKLGLALVYRNLDRGDEAGVLLNELAALHPENLELRRLLHQRFLELDEIP